MDSDHQLVICAGLHRSGTSLLARALAAHPEASGFSDTGFPEDEGQFLQSVFPTARTFGGPGRFGFDPRAHLTEDSELVSTANRERLLAEWSAHWDLSRRVLVEKSPPNLIKLRFLQALCPEAMFVVVVRHPVAVALATRKWSRTSVDSLLDHWARCHEIFRADAGLIGALTIVRYEDLIADPEAILAALLERLAMTPTAEPLLAARPGLNERYFEQWEPARNPFSRRRHAAYLRRYEGRIAAFGYSLADPANLSPVTIAGRSFLGNAGPA